MDGDSTVDMFRDMKAARKNTRRLFGRNCPKCRELRPKAFPSLLMPGQRCRVDGYIDPRAPLTDQELHATQPLDPAAAGCIQPEAIKPPDAPKAFSSRSSSVLRNLDKEDLTSPVIAIHYARNPNSLISPVLILVPWLSDPENVGKKVAAILNDNWDKPCYNQKDQSNQDD